MATVEETNLEAARTAQRASGMFLAIPVIILLAVLLDVIRKKR